MKTHRLASVLAALIATAIPSAFAADRVINLRAVSAAGDFPGSEVFAHAPGSKEPGTKITVKGYLNHEADAVTAEAGTLLLTARSASPAGADKSALLAEVKIPAKARSGILLFLPGIKKGPGTARLIEDDRKSFPPGSTMVINHTGYELRLEIEGKNFDVKAEGSMVIREQPVGDANASAVKGFIKEGAKWEMIYSALWTHPGGKRVIQTACENTQTGRPEIKGIKDISAPQ